MESIIKIGDYFIDKWDRKRKCVRFGGMLGLFEEGESVTNEYGITAPCTLVGYKDGKEVEYCNIGNIKALLPNEPPK